MEGVKGPHQLGWGPHQSVCKGRWQAPSHFLIQGRKCSHHSFVKWVGHKLSAYFLAGDAASALTIVMALGEMMWQAPASCSSDGRVGWE